jgi:spermidine synthase
MKGSLAATLILFAPSTLLLGMVSPMAIRLLSDAGVGRAAGRVFAISTVGSIVGTYLPTLWLIPTYGSRMTLLIAAAMIVAPAVVGLFLSLGWRGAPLAVVAVVGWTGTRAIAELRPNRGEPALPWNGKAVVREERESAYQYLTVREDSFPGPPPETDRYLTINEGVFTYHSVVVDNSILTGGKYYDDYALLPALTDVPAGGELRGAIVGLAGGVTANQWHHFWEGPYRLHVDGAEIDPDVIALGRKYHFGLPEHPEPWLRELVMDGRQMLEAVPAGTEYDMLVVDAFSQELYIPFHLGTREFFELCKRRLADGGVFAMNVYAYQPDSPNLVALANTLATVFGRCERVQQKWGGNFLLVARKGAAPADVTRLLKARIASRFGARGDVTEWDQLVEQGTWVPEHAQTVLPDPEKMVLTDDRCPLERMTDRFVEREESKMFGE